MFAGVNIFLAPLGLVWVLDRFELGGVATVAATIWFFASILAAVIPYKDK